MLSDHTQHNASVLQSYNEHDKVRCFSRNSAATFEKTIIQRNQTPTINIDAAKAQTTANIPGQRKYDWSQKITLQLSASELYTLACVCLGYLPMAEFKRERKGISLVRQSQKLYLKASESEKSSISLPITMSDCFCVGNLTLTQLLLQSHHNDSTLLMASLRGAAALYRIYD